MNRTHNQIQLIDHKLKQKKISLQYEKLQKK